MKMTEKPRDGGRLRAMQRGFTLTELMVTVLIIALLSAIALYGLSAMREMADEQQASNLLSKAKMMAGEYQAATGRILDHRLPADQEDPYRLQDLQQYEWDNFERNAPDATGTGDLDIGDNASDSDEFKARSIERFVWATFNVPQVRDLYGPIEEGGQLTDGDGNGFLELRDPWGGKLVYAPYVALNGNPGDDTPGDGFRADDFLPRHDRPFFASPGPDGRWGNANANSGAGDQAAQDNIYSFELE